MAERSICVSVKHLQINRIKYILQHDFTERITGHIIIQNKLYHTGQFRLFDFKSQQIITALTEVLLYESV